MSKFENILMEELIDSINEEVGNKKICDFEKIKAEIEIRKQLNEQNNKNTKAPKFRLRFSIVSAIVFLLIGGVLGVSGTMLVNHLNFYGTTIQMKPHYSIIEKNASMLVSDGIMNICVAFDDSNHIGYSNALKMYEKNNLIRKIKNNYGNLKDGYTRVFLGIQGKKDYIYVVDKNYIYQYNSLLPYSIYEVKTKFEERIGQEIEDSYLYTNNYNIYLRYVLTNHGLDYYYQFTYKDIDYIVKYINGGLKVYACY